MTIINQMVDTLKLHYYHAKELTDEQISSFNNFVQSMKEKKELAKEIKSNNDLDRFVPHTINNVNFKVLAKTHKSFSALLINADIDIDLKQITPLSLNPCIKVEFRSEFLTRNGYVKCCNIVNNIISSFLPEFKIKVSEIHLATDIQGYDFNSLDRERFKFRNRTLQDYEDTANTLFTAGTKNTGLTFGTGDFMLRVYDKTHQIQKKISADYVRTLKWERNPKYDSNQKVWRIEFQFRREHLKTLVGKDGILDGFEDVLNSIPDIWSYATSRFNHIDLKESYCVDKYLGYTLKNNVKIPLTADTHRKRLYRAGISPMWEMISKFNDIEPQTELHKFKDIKEPNPLYVVNAWKGVVSTFIKHQRCDFNKEQLTKILVEANEETLNKTGFSILDNARFKTVEHINQARTNYHKNGLVIDGFEDFNSDMKSNLKKVIDTLETSREKNNYLTEIIKRGTIVYANS